jgi:spore maturation protein CgeB
VRFLFANRVPYGFLNQYYAEHLISPDKKFAQAFAELAYQSIYSSDFYSRSLRRLGHETYDFVINDQKLQRLWMVENLLSNEVLHRNASYDFVLKKLKWILERGGSLGRFVYHQFRNPVGQTLGIGASEDWIMEVFLQQVKTIRPDILYIHFIHDFDAESLRKIRPYVKKIVGQHASPLPDNIPYEYYDLMVSSLPNLVEHFRRKGIKSEYLAWCFEPEIVKRIENVKVSIDVSFIGGFTHNHRDGIELLEKVAEQIPIDFWGYRGADLPSNSAILKSYKGEAWGLEMYQILAKSKITINRHIDVAGPYANNMRLFEATGMGTLLVTDRKQKLEDFFEIGKEVVLYKDAEECIDRVKFYLKNEDERKRIALAGQQRTLRDHTYSVRMKELNSILERLLGN